MFTHIASYKDDLDANARKHIFSLEATSYPHYHVTLCPAGLSVWHGCDQQTLRAAPVVSGLLHNP